MSLYSIVYQFFGPTCFVTGRGMARFEVPKQALDVR